MKPIEVRRQKSGVRIKAAIGTVSDFILTSDFCLLTSVFYFASTCDRSSLIPGPMVDESVIDFT